MVHVIAVLWKRRGIGGALFRIAVLLGAVLAVAGVAYGLWRPGLEVADGRFDLGRNGIWIGHGWLGDDGWFRRNPDRDKGRFRSEAGRRELAATLREHRIRYAYAHLCPASFSGSIAPHDPAATEALLDEFGLAEIELFAWIGGVNGVSARIGDSGWRRNFCASAAALLEAHPRLAGVQVNVEPLPSGDADFLLLLEELRSALPEGRRLGVAAYPPPTVWHPFPEVHWEPDYLRRVAGRCDQLAVMMYDTSITDRKLYARLMKAWTREILDSVAGLPVEVLPGVPDYDDAGSGYHHPEVEELVTAIRGINAGLAGYPSLPDSYAGLAVYCEWETDAEEWAAWSREFLGR